MASLASTFEHKQREPIVGQRADGELLERANRFGPDAQVGNGLHRALGHGVHHARLRQDVDPRRKGAVLFPAAAQVRAKSRISPF